MNSVPIYSYPADMCETCVGIIEDLITSGEFSQANEQLNEIVENGYDCTQCLELEKENN